MSVQISNTIVMTGGDRSIDDATPVPVSPGASATDAALVAAAVQAAPAGLGGMASVNLPPPQQSGAAEVSATARVLDGFTPGMAETDLTEVMRLFHQIQVADRESKKLLANAATQNAVDMGIAASEQIKSAADERYSGAMVSAAMQIGGGAVQVGGGIAGGVLGIKGAKQSAEGAKKSQDAAEVAKGDPQSRMLKAQAKHYDAAAQGYSYRGTMANSASQGSAQVLAGAGGMVSAREDHDAAMEEALKQRLEAAKTAFDSQAENARQTAAERLDTARDIRDKLSAIDQSNVEANRAIARNI